MKTRAQGCGRGLRVSSCSAAPPLHSLFSPPPAFRLVSATFTRDAPPPGSCFFSSSSSPLARAAAAAALPGSPSDGRSRAFLAGCAPGLKPTARTGGREPEQVRRAERKGPGRAGPCLGGAGPEEGARRLRCGRPPGKRRGCGVRPWRRRGRRALSQDANLRARPPLGHGGRRGDGALFLRAGESAPGGFLLQKPPPHLHATPRPLLLCVCVGGGRGETPALGSQRESRG